MGIQERKAKEKQRLRQLILDAARELFVDEGYESVSMRKIAHKIDYSPTTIYHHFKDKAELLVSICESTHLDLLNTLDLHTNDLSDPVEALRKSARSYVEFGLKHPQEYKVTFIIRPQYQKGLGLPHGSVPERMFEQIGGVIQACVKQERFRPVDAQATTQAIWAAMHGVTSLLISFPDFPWADEGALITQVVETMIQGLEK